MSQVKILSTNQLKVLNELLILLQINNNSSHLFYMILTQFGIVDIQVTHCQVLFVCFVCVCFRKCKFIYFYFIYLFIFWLALTVIVIALY